MVVYGVVPVPAIASVSFAGAYRALQRDRYCSPFLGDDESTTLWPEIYCPFSYLYSISGYAAIRPSLTSPKVEIRACQIGSSQIYTQYICIRCLSDCSRVKTGFGLIPKQVSPRLSRFPRPVSVSALSYAIPPGFGLVPGQVFWNCSPVLWANQSNSSIVSNLFA